MAPLPTVVRCDTCRRDFPINLWELPVPDGGVHIAMLCPHCDREYPIARLTKRGLELRAVIEQLRGRTDASARIRLEALLPAYQREVTGLSGVA